jgi:23S rRNA (uracil1939-C5)-methyltransferase
MRQRLTIDTLGAKGDGIALSHTGSVFVGGALPGEVIEADVEGERGKLVEIIISSPDRIHPECSLFGTCGGCAVQHLGEAPYRAWKTAQIGIALKREGLSAPVGELINAHGTGRRRATFHIRKMESRVVTGFMARGSHRLIPIEHCPVLAPELADAPKIADVLGRLMIGSSKPLDIQITASVTGPDVDIRGHGPANDRMRASLVQAATALGLARVSMHGETIVERQSPMQKMGVALAAPPAGGFLQATQLGEDTLSALVIDAIKGLRKPAKKVLDLFAGSGPFALRIGMMAGVHAVESEKGAVDALLRGARGIPGLRSVTGEVRDLFRRPLLDVELNLYDAIVLDPPRAGAEAQCARIATSKVKLVVYVSCDPVSFARDAATLVRGGYDLMRVTPVDQFRYSHHVELVGIFTRPK